MILTGDPVAARYAQAVFESAKADGALEETLEQLSLIGALLRDHQALRELISNPGVTPDDKVSLFERLLHGSWSSLVRSFVAMVVALERAEVLPQISQTLQVLVDAERQVLRVTVRSAYPLPHTVLERLRVRLEHREQQHITMTTEVDGKLLGGLQVIMGSRVMDTSVRRQLDDLRERLMAVRVY